VYVAMVVLWAILGRAPALQDYPEWIYQGHILSEKIFGCSSCFDHFELFHYPIPNATVSVLLAIGDIVTDPLTSSKTLIVIYAIAGALLAIRASALFDEGTRGASTFFLISIVVFSGSFWNGYLNYQIGLLVLFLYMIEIEQKSERRAWFHLAFSVLLFFSHFVIYGIFLLVYLFTYIIVIAPRRTGSFAEVLGGFAPRRCWPVVPSLLLALWYVMGRLHGSSIDVAVHRGKEVGDSFFQFMLYKVYTAMKLGPFHAFELPDGTIFAPPYSQLYWMGVGVNFVFALLIFIHLCSLIPHRLALGLTVSAEPRHRVPIFLLLVGFLLSPQFAAGIVNLGERLLLPALLMAVIYCKPSRALLNAYALTCCVVIPCQFAFLLQYDQTGSQPAGGWKAAYFTHRPYQFAPVVDYLAGARGGDAPDLSFSTGLLQQRRQPRAGSGAGPSRREQGAGRGERSSAAAGGRGVPSPQPARVSRPAAVGPGRPS
jgi:hypothetical protein